jgi:hypothetical protein
MDPSVDVVAHEAHALDAVDRDDDVGGADDVVGQRLGELLRQVQSDRLRP